MLWNISKISIGSSWKQPRARYWKSEVRFSICDAALKSRTTLSEPRWRRVGLPPSISSSVKPSISRSVSQWVGQYMRSSFSTISSRLISQVNNPHWQICRTIKGSKKTWNPSDWYGSDFNPSSNTIQDTDEKQKGVHYFSVSTFLPHFPCERLFCNEVLFFYRGDKQIIFPISSFFPF